MPIENLNLNVQRNGVALHTLRFFSHRRSEGDADQQSFGRKETSDSLAPGLLLVLEKNSISLRFKSCRCILHAVNVELQPCLWDRDVFGPRVFAETRMRRLGKGPQGEGFRALKSFGMEIPATFLERNAEGFAVEFAAFGRLSNNGTKTGDE